MNVILLEKIGKLGEIGETANVKSGYARNFLFPKGKAIPATKDNLEHFEQRKAELLAAHNQKVAEAQKRAEKVKGLSLTIEVMRGMRVSCLVLLELEKSLKLLMLNPEPT